MRAPIPTAAPDPGFSIEAAVAHLHAQLGQCDAASLIIAAFRAKVPLHTATEFAQLLDVDVGTLQSRFRRAGAPSVKDLLAGVLFVRAAQLLEEHPGKSIAWLAEQLVFSSPQHLGRCIQHRYAIPASVWRTQASAVAEFDRFCRELIDPYVEPLRRASTAPARPKAVPA